MWHVVRNSCALCFACCVAISQSSAQQRGKDAATTHYSFAEPGAFGCAADHMVGARLRIDDMRMHTSVSAFALARAARPDGDSVLLPPRAISEPGQPDPALPLPAHLLGTVDLELCLSPISVEVVGGEWTVHGTLGDAEVVGTGSATADGVDVFMRSIGPVTGSSSLAWTLSLNQVPVRITSGAGGTLDLTASGRYDVHLLRGMEATDG